MAFIGCTPDTLAPSVGHHTSIAPMPGAGAGGGRRGPPTRPWPGGGRGGRGRCPAAPSGPHGDSREGIIPMIVLRPVCAKDARRYSILARAVGCPVDNVVPRLPRAKTLPIEKLLKYSIVRGVISLDIDDCARHDAVQIFYVRVYLRRASRGETLRIGRSARREGR